MPVARCPAGAPVVKRQTAGTAPAARNDTAPQPARPHHAGFGPSNRPGTAQTGEDRAAPSRECGKVGRLNEIQMAYMENEAISAILRTIFGAVFGAVFGVVFTILGLVLALGGRREVIVVQK